MKTISLSDPVSGTSRSAEVTVTFVPSAESTVTGSRGAGTVASGSTRSARAAVADPELFVVPPLSPSPLPPPAPQPAVTRASASAEMSAPARR